VNRCRPMGKRLRDACLLQGRDDVAQAVQSLPSIRRATPVLDVPAGTIECLADVGPATLERDSYLDRRDDVNGAIAVAGLVRRSWTVQAWRSRVSEATAAPCSVTVLTTSRQSAMSCT
jgi:hypothetical protein